MRKLQAGNLIALSAILVQAPRLVLALLSADRQPVSSSVERILLVVSGIGTAVVLTGGNLYLAHTVATVRRWRPLLVVVWIVVLASSGALTVPMIAAGLSGRTLPSVLASGAAAWGWAVFAALAHELTAAGCILAGAVGAGSEPSLPASEPRLRVSEPELTEASEARLPGLEPRLLAAKPELPAAETRLPEASEARLAGSEPAQQAASGGASAEPSGAGWQDTAVSPVSAPEPPQSVRCRAGCGRSFRSSWAEAGHLPHCPVRQDGFTKE